MKTEYDEILYMKTHQDGHNKPDFTSTDHDDSNTSLPCLLYVLNEFVMFSLLFAGLIFLLITIFSGLFFSYAMKLLDSLSNKLDQTLWPCLIIQIFYMLLSKLHVLLTAYFQEEFKTFAFFYEIIRHANTALFASHTNKMSFNTSNILVCHGYSKKISKAFVCCLKSIFIENDYKKFLQELSTTLTRLLMPGKLISDTPEEAHSIQCTDTTASYNDKCNALLLNNYRETTHCDYKAVSFENACTSDDDFDINENVSISVQEIKQDDLSLKDSDTSFDGTKQLQHLLIVPKPISHQQCSVNSSVEYPVSFCVNDNIYKKYQSNHLQLARSIIDKQNTIKDYR